MTITNVVVAIAMEAEASPFVNHLNLQPDLSFFPSETPFRAFRGKHNNCHLTVITNGKDEVHGTGVDNVGTVPAATATFLTLQKLKNGEPADLLINAGTCGGFQVCDVIVHNMMG
jgi:5'-methylthioadenosine nucleosidase